MKYQELVEKAEAHIKEQGDAANKPWVGMLRDFVAALKKSEEKMEKQAEKAKKKKEKDNKPERTIESMFRITATNSQRLSDQADSKANIMISVNTVVVPALFFIQNQQGSEKLIIPIVTLLSVNVLTIIFAILATRPQIPPGVFTQEQIENKKADLLFFGNFYRMSFNEYVGGMFKIMGDKEFLHTTLLLDIYNQGIVLGRKYRMLTIAYNIFMYGIILTVIAFFVALKPGFLH